MCLGNKPGMVFRVHYRRIEHLLGDKSVCRIRDSDWMLEAATTPSSAIVVLKSKQGVDGRSWRSWVQRPPDEFTCSSVRGKSWLTPKRTRSNSSSWTSCYSDSNEISCQRWEACGRRGTTAVVAKVLTKASYVYLLSLSVYEYTS